MYTSGVEPQLLGQFQIHPCRLGRLNHFFALETKKAGCVTPSCVRLPERMFIILEDNAQTQVNGELLFMVPCLF